MKIVCSSSMPFVAEAFSALGDVSVLEGRAIGPDDVRNAEILAIRSTTKTNRALLEGSRVRFVGTATIGFDHIDREYLDQAGIRWCYSPGCNANSVSEYVTTALLRLTDRHNLTFDGKTMGIIGVGNVGRLVAKKAAALGMRVLLNDPPRARAEDPELFSSLETVLRESDIITMHVPLTKDGLDPTFQMVGASFFDKMKTGCVFINSARGPIMNTDALLAAMDMGTVAHAIIDTWEDEPVLRNDLLERVDIATPHIAGYSFEGKVAGTLMVYREVCRFLEIEPTWTPEPLMPPPDVPAAISDAAGKSDEQALWQLVRQVYDIERDDKNLREITGEDDTARGGHFDTLRKNYPIRREFRYTKAVLKNASPRLHQKAISLGFAT